MIIHGKAFARSPIEILAQAENLLGQASVQNIEQGKLYVSLAMAYIELAQLLARINCSWTD